MTALSELRLAVRSLRKAPGFAFGAILTLALGIGANTAIFSVANAILLRRLPLRNEGQLVHVGEWRLPSSDPFGFLSPSDFAVLRERRDIFSQMAVSTRATRSVLVGDGPPEELQGREISPELFDLAGVEPIVGRKLLAADAAAGAPWTILVSSRLWHRRLGGRPDFVGRSLRLNNVLYEIVGVMPPDWDRLDDSDFWTVYRLAEDLPNHVKYLDSVMARLKPGLSLGEAQAAVDLIAKGLGPEYSDDGNRSVRFQLVAIRRHLIGDFWNPLLALLGAAGFVLLIACANMANLLLARAAGRGSEVAIRKALGASPRDLAVHVLAEALVLAAAGASFALPLAAWGTKLLTASAPADVWQLRSASLDWRVLSFCAFLALVTAALFGLAPTLWTARVPPQEALKAAGTSGRSPFGRRGAGSVLVIAEVGLAFALLVAAGLMIQSLWRLQRVDLGLVARHLVVSEVWLPRYRYPDEARRRAFFQELLARVRRQPEIDSAGIISFLPVGPYGYEHRFVRLPGSSSPTEKSEAMAKIVDGGYFRAAGIPLLRGRTFTEFDDDRSEAVALVSESCSRLYFPRGDAVGGRLEVSFPASWQTLTVIGVVGDVASWPEARIEPGVYFSYRQRVVPTMSLVIRSSLGPDTVQRMVRHEVAALDPDQTVETARPMRDVLAAEIAARRFLALLLKMFAALALVLAVTGIYAVLSALVARRRCEIGIRAALGARRGDVVALFVGQSLRWSAVGILLGAGVAVGLTRLLAGSLFGVTSTDPATFGLCGMVLLLAGLAGAYLPARAGARVDPMVAMRSE